MSPQKCEGKNKAFIYERFGRYYESVNDESKALEQYTNATRYYDENGGPIEPWFARKRQRVLTHQSQTSTFDARYHGWRTQDITEAQVTQDIMEGAETQDIMEGQDTQDIKEGRDTQDITEGQDTQDTQDIIKPLVTMGMDILVEKVSRDITVMLIKEDITAGRSEERRVGKECRSRWSPDH